MNTNSSRMNRTVFDSHRMMFFKGTRCAKTGEKDQLWSDRRGHRTSEYKADALIPNKAKKKNNNNKAAEHLKWFSLSNPAVITVL